MSFLRISESSAGLGEKGNALLKAYVDADTGQSIGSDPVWIGWEAENMAVLKD